MQSPTKTFALSTPMEVFEKLDFDLQRLKTARSTKALQFAAMDLALWGYHMIEWVLATLSDERHLELSGKKRNERGAVAGFVARQSVRIGTLGFCEQIANTGKHRVLTRTRDDPGFSTHHTIRFRPPFNVAEPFLGTITAEVFFKDTTTGQEIDAVRFFEAMLEQWRGFLKQERLYDWSYGYEPLEPDLDED